MTEALPTALEIARALVAFPLGDARGCGRPALSRGAARAAGFRTEIVSFSAPGTPDILNLYARIGTAAPNFVFAGHTDVVPPGDAARWRFDPFAGTVADGRLWGRGTADMKGGVAASVAAALRFAARGAFPARSASSSPATRKARPSTARSS